MKTYLGSSRMVVVQVQTVVVPLGWMVGRGVRVCPSAAATEARRRKLDTAIMQTNRYLILDVIYH